MIVLFTVLRLLALLMLVVICLCGYLQFTPMKGYEFFVALYFTIYLAKKRREGITKDD